MCLSFSSLLMGQMSLFSCHRSVSALVVADCPAPVGAVMFGPRDIPLEEPRQTLRRGRSAEWSTTRYLVGRWTVVSEHVVAPCKTCRPPERILDSQAPQTLAGWKQPKPISGYTETGALVIGRALQILWLRTELVIFSSNIRTTERWLQALVEICDFGLQIRAQHTE